MRKFLEAAVILMATFGWWGFVYPELSMVAESCTQETEIENEGAAPLIKIGEELGSTGIVSGNFRIKSRIAEYLYQGKEKDKAEKESGYERQECTHRGV